MTAIIQPQFNSTTSVPPMTSKPHAIPTTTTYNRYSTAPNNKTEGNTTEIPEILIPILKTHSAAHTVNMISEKSQLYTTLKPKQPKLNIQQHQ